MTLELLRPMVLTDAANQRRSVRIRPGRYPLVIVPHPWTEGGARWAVLNDTSVGAALGWFQWAAREWPDQVRLADGAE